MILDVHSDSLTLYNYLDLNWKCLFLLSVFIFTFPILDVSYRRPFLRSIKFTRNHILCWFYIFQHLWQCKILISHKFHVYLRITFKHWDFLQLIKISSIPKVLVVNFFQHNISWLMYYSTIILLLFYSFPRFSWVFFTRSNNYYLLALNYFIENSGLTRQYHKGRPNFWIRKGNTPIYSTYATLSQHCHTETNQHFSNCKKWRTFHAFKTGCRNLKYYQIAYRQSRVKFFEKCFFFHSIGW